MDKIFWHAILYNICIYMYTNISYLSFRSRKNTSLYCVLMCPVCVHNTLYFIQCVYMLVYTNDYRFNFFDVIHNTECLINKKD